MACTVLRVELFVVTRDTVCMPVTAVRARLSFDAGTVTRAVAFQNWNTVGWIINYILEKLSASLAWGGSFNYSLHRHLLFRFETYGPQRSKHYGPFSFLGSLFFRR
jgi:hypothetical protein